MYQRARRYAKLIVDALQLELFDQDDSGECVVVDGMQTAEPELSTDGAVHLDYERRCRAQPQRLSVESTMRTVEYTVQPIRGALKLAQRRCDRGLDVGQFGSDARVVVNPQHCLGVGLDASLPVCYCVCEDAEMIEDMSKVLARCRSGDHFAFKSVRRVTDGSRAENLDCLIHDLSRAREQVLLCLFPRGRRRHHGDDQCCGCFGTKSFRTGVFCDELREQ